MDITKQLLERSGAKCELCSSEDDLKVYNVPPEAVNSIDKCILVCNTCKEQIENPEKVVVNHWRCLNDSMWNENTPVQVMAWRMLNRLKLEVWPQDLLDMLYLDEETLTWAKSTGEGVDQDEVLKHIDSNGVELIAGDTVVLIKDLNVKGAGFTAKRGTAVRGITLVQDNSEHIEGKINGQQIIILTKFVKKSN
jgi:protein PhnA